MRRFMAFSFYQFLADRHHTSSGFIPSMIHSTVKFSNNKMLVMYHDIQQMCDVFVYDFWHVLLFFEDKGSFDNVP